jgi:hypothetical protein
VNGKVYLDLQGKPDAVFIFQTDCTLVAMAGSIFPFGIIAGFICCSLWA